MVSGWIASYVFILIFWSRCCCCCLLLLLPTTSVLKRREMLGTSIAAVVLGYFYFGPLDYDASFMVVDCAAVETACVLEKYIKVAHLLRVLQQKAIYTYLVRIQNNRFIFPFDEINRRLLFFTLGRSVSA